MQRIITAWDQSWLQGHSQLCASCKGLAASSTPISTLVPSKHIVGVVGVVGVAGGVGVVVWSCGGDGGCGRRRE